MENSENEIMENYKEKRELFLFWIIVNNKYSQIAIPELNFEDSMSWRQTYYLTKNSLKPFLEKIFYLEPAYFIKKHFRDNGTLWDMESSLDFPEKSLVLPRSVYLKSKNNLPLNADELNAIFETKDEQQYIYPHLCIRPDIDSKAFFRKKLDDYIGMFENDLLNQTTHDAYEEPYFNSRKSIEDLLPFLQNYSKNHVPRNILIIPDNFLSAYNISNGALKERYIKKLRFIETMLLAEKQKIIKISAFYINGTFRVDLLKKIDKTTEESKFKIESVSPEVRESGKNLRKFPQLNKEKSRDIINRLEHPIDWKSICITLLGEEIELKQGDKKIGILTLEDLGLKEPKNTSETGKKKNSVRRLFLALFFNNDREEIKKLLNTKEGSVSQLKKSLSDKMSEFFGSNNDPITSDNGIYKAVFKTELGEDLKIDDRFSGKKLYKSDDNQESQRRWREDKYN